jgi:hypothetical protein
MLRLLSSIVRRNRRNQYMSGLVLPAVSDIYWWSWSISFVDKGETTIYSKSAFSLVFTEVTMKEIIHLATDQKMPWGNL